MKYFALIREGLGQPVKLFGSEERFQFKPILFATGILFIILTTILIATSLIQEFIIAGGKNYDYREPGADLLFIPRSESYHLFFALSWSFIAVYLAGTRYVMTLIVSENRGSFKTMLAAAAVALWPVVIGAATITAVNNLLPNISMGNPQWSLIRISVQIMVLFGLYGYQIYLSVRSFQIALQEKLSRAILIAMTPDIFACSGLSILTFLGLILNNLGTP